MMRHWVLFLFILFISSGQASGNKYTLVVYKSKRVMHILKNNKVVKTYKIVLGGDPIGHKQFYGDQKTPEGTYKISGKNPNSQFHKSLRISYPSEKDKKYAQSQGKDAGGDIMIHGLGKSFSWLGKSHVLRDWTLGCIAVTNQEIEEIYNLIPVGAPITLHP